jgi:glycosyltransferase involved in cell wall biosynthesis
MNKNRGISVIMSVFNAEMYINKSVDSILNQTHPNFEFLVVDDGSKDSTFNLLQKYQQQDNRIKIFRNKKNIGLTKSLNFLISQSKNSLIARQDADDFSFKDRLEKQVNFLFRKNLSLCGTRGYSNNRLRPNLSYYLPTKLTLKFKNPFLHGSLLIKKEELNSVGNYDEKFIFAQDYKLISDFIKARYRIGMLNEPLYELNTKDNISTIFKKEQKYFADCVRKNKEPEFYQNENLQK